MIRFVLGPDRRWEAEHIADVLATFTGIQPGNCGFQFLADHENGEYQTLSFWDTKENWQASFEVMWPIFVDTIGDHFQWAPAVQCFEVYEPKLLSFDGAG